MTPELWETLTEEQQQNHCWQELTRLMLSVQPPPLQPGNEETGVVPGLTTLIYLRRRETESA